MALVAWIYVDRLLKATQTICGQNARITELNAKGIWHTAMALAAKFFLDRYEKKTIFFGVSINCTREHMR